ncbi:hypothetical protein L228DRAFT_170353 [Xylona heveae TC161]|uniref:P-loop containing nucleoside triphosphate hydrolase protein n=1 Tax=Xylona heveae (strain CBS 132557 / TC161) TaxID=1328760 RepID=A0A165FSD9_XYLHT|nr:hypothetical protein L228DRAFT_170353 [Xylona heveae TC161]KZF21318.1 hypothetical protein L228DRAFT_170353 [Xylona heveae TC161]
MAAPPEKSPANSGKSAENDEKLDANGVNQSETAHDDDDDDDEDYEDKEDEEGEDEKGEDEDVEDEEKEGSEDEDSEHESLLDGELEGLLHDRKLPAEERDEVVFQNPKLAALQDSHKEILNLIDSLREQGLSRYVALPEIVVCGDQSAGKSSVLEAISGVGFPVNDGFCTRFTTELILRRSSMRQASARIIPSITSTPERRNKLESFQKHQIKLDKIAEVITEAKALMGLAEDRALSRDILRLDITGPDLPHLTLIDLPGLVHSSTKQEEAFRVDLSRNLVESYMQRERSIILAIVSAKNDFHNQLVISLVQKDDRADRTLGIVTKPDCLAPGSPSEEEFYRLVKNQELHLELGWHMLRNGGFLERANPSFDRDEEEARYFKETSPWRALQESEIGVSSLRHRLSEILHKQIQEELPELTGQLRDMLDECRRSLEVIGPCRDSPGKQRVYLMNLSKRFQTLTRGAIMGDYLGDDFKNKFFDVVDAGRGQFGNRLRARIRALTEQFASDMRKRGHSFQIIDGDNGAQMLNIDRGVDAPPVKWKSDFVNETRMLLEKNKGLELPGLFSPYLVGDLFRMHSINWKEISEEFVSETCDAAREYLEELLGYIAEPSSSNIILNELIGPAVDERNRILDEKLKELRSPYTGAFAMTQSPRFIRHVERLRKLRLEKEGQPTTNKNVAGTDTFACVELIDCMQAYYNTVIEVFIDNVITLGVENCLMKDMDAIFDPEMIIEMENEELAKLASEPAHIRARREQLLEQQAVLENGLNTLRKQQRKMRPIEHRFRKNNDQSASTTFGAPSLQQRDQNDSVNGDRNRPSSLSNPSDPTPQRNPVPSSGVAPFSEAKSTDHGAQHTSTQTSGGATHGKSPSSFLGGNNVNVQSKPSPSPFGGSSGNHQSVFYSGPFGGKVPSDTFGGFGSGISTAQNQPFASNPGGSSSSNAGTGIGFGGGSSSPFQGTKSVPPNAFGAAPTSR